MTLQTLSDTGSPVVRSILSFRNSYWCRLSVALLATTAPIALWAAVELNASGTVTPESSGIVTICNHAFLQIAPDSLHAVQAPPPNDTNTPVPGGEIKIDIRKHNLNIPLSEKSITTGYQSVPLKEVLNDVSAKANVMFTYSEQLVDGKSVTIEQRNWPVDELLKKVLEPSGLSYYKCSRMTSIYKPL